MSAETSSEFLDEVCRTLKVKAQRKVRDEMSALKKRNASLEKRLGDETAALNKIELAEESAQRAIKARESAIKKKEADVNLAIAEIKYLYKQVQELREMTVRKFVTGSTDNWGCMSNRAKALSKISRSKV